MHIRKRLHEAKYEAKGGRTGNERLLFKLLKKRPALLLCGVSLLLLAVAGITYLSIYHEGDTAKQNAQNLLTEYNQTVSESPTGTVTAVSAAPSAAGTVPAGSSLPSDGYVQPAAPDLSPQEALVSLPGYDVIGKLTIEKIGLELPVISNTTTKALKVSICWYEGVLPGEKGNMVITGHNYADGAHFGMLDKLAKGDAVVLDAPGGKVYRYEVCETLIVKPDNLGALEIYEGDYALTLLTCASSGNRRLLVRCRLL